MIDFHAAAARARRAKAAADLDFATLFPALTFEEKAHRYTHNGRVLTSVTTYIGRFKEKFDAPATAARMAEKPGETRTAAQLLAEWKAKADASCEHGTAVHSFIENWLYSRGDNARRNSLIDDCLPSTWGTVQGFLDLYANRLRKLTPVAQEQRIYDAALGIAGTVDALLRDADGALWVFDWKTNGKFRTTDADTYGRRLLPPFDTLPDNELNLYSVQLSLYRLILQRAGIETRGAMLVHLPLDGVAQMHRAPDLRPGLLTHFAGKGVVCA